MELSHHELGKFWQSMNKNDSPVVYKLNFLKIPDIKQIGTWKFADSPLFIYKMILFLVKKNNWLIRLLQQVCQKL